MNIAEKIIASATGKTEVFPGDIVISKVNMAMANEITGPLAIEAFKKIGSKNVWDRNKIVLILDHQIPADSIKSAELHNIMRKFSKKYDIPFLYDVGEGGVCHQVMIEKGHVRPGELVVGADSHTCTYGAVGAFATGIGSTEMAGVFYTGKIWLKVPSTIRINIVGTLSNFITPKDIILYLVGKIGADGATYKAIEFTGSTITKMSLSGRMTLCNMTVEMGAKTGLINPNEAIVNYVKKRTDLQFKVLNSDENAKFERTIEISIDDLKPQIACPHSVDNVKPVAEVEGENINQAFIGSCTNGRLEDLELAAKILKGRKIKKGIRLIITPASQDIYLQSLKNGLTEIFVKSGAYVCSPTCGACFGGHMGILAEDEVCISSSNRNFLGRMGSPKAQVYLASPITVAASAIAGEIIDPRRYLEVEK
jgi:3-isopropylmalate/(R)-2-methylmalate dehydratase large subunit